MLGPYQLVELKKIAECVINENKRLFQEALKTEEAKLQFYAEEVL